jgi:Cu(I)/Ag(I) efflux system membrane protein CusA/SilA
VIYLEEAVARRRAADGGMLSRVSLREAVVEGALLRLRPKVMTVSTVVAGLLPIMWSTRVGAEVMKPIAAPVLGGMVSSLAHVLLITPVIFFWLRARSIERTDATAESESRPMQVHGRSRRRVWLVTALGAGVLLVSLVLWLRPFGGRGAEGIATQVIQQLESGDLRVLLKSADAGLHQGRAAFTLEFRSATTGALVDVGSVRLVGAMTMPGMVMPAGIEVQRVGVGLYSATAEFGMAGAWRFTLEWNGPAGSGQLTFDGDVR